MASETILAFLLEHNRPFSINELQSGIKNQEEIGKAALQKALNTLVGSGKIKEKLYGKQKIYCITQNKNLSSKEISEKVIEFDRNINHIAEQTKKLKEKIKLKTQTLAKIGQQISLEEAIDKKIKLEIEIQSINSQLEQFNEVETDCCNKKLEVENEYEKLMKEYKKRKRMCMDMLDAILENYSKSKQQLLEEIGIETDADVGFSLDNIK